MVNTDWNKIKHADMIKKSIITIGIGLILTMLLVSTFGRYLGFAWLSLIFVFTIGVSLLVAWQLVSIPAMITHKEELIRLKGDLSWLSQISKEGEFSQWANETCCLAETILKDGSAYQAEYILCKTITRCQQETLTSSRSEGRGFNIDADNSTTKQNIFCVICLFTVYIKLSFVLL